MATARHTLTVRLPRGATDDGTVATVLATASRRWWPDGPQPRLWTETVPAPADSERAARRRETETRRQLGPGQLLRVLLLRYEEGAGESGGGFAGGSAHAPAAGATDGVAGTRAGRTADEPAGEPAQGTVRPPVPRPGDLVLVADPTALDTSSLRLISRVLCGELGPDEVRTAEHSPAAHPARVPGPEVLRRAAATALVRGRYEGRSSVCVTVPLSALDRPGNTLGAFDGRAVLEADLSEDRTVGELLATPLTAPGDDVLDEAIDEPAPSSAMSRACRTSWPRCRQRRLSSTWSCSTGRSPPSSSPSAARPPRRRSLPAVSTRPSRTRSPCAPTRPP